MKNLINKVKNLLSSKHFKATLYGTIEYTIAVGLTAGGDILLKEYANTNVSDATFVMAVIVMGQILQRVGKAMMKKYEARKNV